MNGARPQAELFPVWDPHGKMHQKTREQITDLVRHGTVVETGDMVIDEATGKEVPEKVKLPWTTTDPTAHNKKVLDRAKALAFGQQKAQAAPAAQAGIHSKAQTPHVMEEMSTIPKLQALRKELEGLNVPVDPGWGQAELQKRIAAAKKGLPQPKDPEDDEDHE